MKNYSLQLAKVRCNFWREYSTIWRISCRSILLWHSIATANDIILCILEFTQGKSYSGNADDDGCLSHSRSGAQG